MTTAARTHLGTRYGSPAEVAAFLGASTETDRRAVESGAPPSFRVGRRVLVAFRDADQFVRRIPAMAIAHPTEAPLIDPATGRLRPPSDQARPARPQALPRALP